MVHVTMGCSIFNSPFLQTAPPSPPAPTHPLFIEGKLWHMACWKLSPKKPTKFWVPTIKQIRVPDSDLNKGR